MSVASFQDIMDHVGHDVVATFYGLEGKRENAENATIECETCGEILVQYDKDED